MMMSSQTVRLVSALALSLGCLSLGCKPVNKPAPPAESNLKVLSVFYGRYIQTHQGQTPPDAEAFKKFITSMPASELETFKVTDVEKLFVSPRDGQLCVVRYGFALPPPGPTGAPVVAYEKVGVNGRRYVAYSVGGVDEVDEARFRQLVPQT